MSQIERIKTDVKKSIEGLAGTMMGGADPKDTNAQRLQTKNQNDMTKYMNQLGVVNAEYLKLCYSYKEDQNFDYSACLANFLGRAFVSFQYQHFAQVLRISMKRHNIKMGENTLRAVWAPSPRDVKWANLHINPWVRRKKEFISFLILIGAILFSFVIQVGVQVFQMASGPKGDKKPSAQMMREYAVIGTLIGILSSLLIFLVNSVLCTSPLTQSEL